MIPLVLTPILLAACTGAPDADQAAAPAATPTARRPDIVLVTLDTTRADRIGAYGYDKAGTDWIDAKAAAGMRFTRAYSVQPLTIPSHSSIFTGLWPWRHGVRSNGDSVLPDDVTTLTERLEAGGWQTVASVSAFVTSRAWGFSQGFDTYFDEMPKSEAGAWHQERPARPVIDDAVSWLESDAKADSPVFMWVHLYDAHFPYQPPEDYLQDYRERPYDGEIAYMDDQLERLEKAFAAQGRDPIWVLIGDHGESLGEHREITHGLFVYDATQHVPFVISGPGVDPAVIDQPVSQVDLVPTVLSLAGRPVPDDIDGKVQPGNPKPEWMESFQLAEQYRYAPHLAIVDGNYKLIDKPVPELYDLLADPGERTNLAEAQPQEVARLEGLIEQLAPQMPSTRTQALDPDSLARLESLGYITASTFDVDFASLPDPSLHKEIIGKVVEADMKASRGQIEEGIRLMTEALADEPDLPNVHMRLVRLHYRAGNRDEARRLSLAAVERFPDDPDVKLRAATIQGRDGNDERSLALAREALEVDPENGRAAEFVAGSLLNLERHDEMLAFADEWLEKHPDATNIAALKGILLFDTGLLPQAEKALRQAAKDPRPRPGVYQRLGAMALGAGQPDDALRWLQQEQDVHGNSTQTEHLLVQAHLKLGNKDKVLEHVDNVLAERPEAADAWNAKVIALFDTGQLAEAHKTVDDALAIHPDDPDLLLMLANILKKEGKQEEALSAKARADAANQKRVEERKAQAEQLRERIKAEGKAAEGKAAVPPTGG